MRTIDIIIYVVAVVVLVVAALVSPLVQRLFAVALACIVLVPLITLARS